MGPRDSMRTALLDIAPRPRAGAPPNVIGTALPNFALPPPGYGLRPSYAPQQFSHGGHPMSGPHPGYPGYGQPPQAGFRHPGAHGGHPLPGPHPGGSTPSPNVTALPPHYGFPMPGPHPIYPGYGPPPQAGFRHPGVPTLLPPPVFVSTEAARTATEKQRSVLFICTEIRYKVA